MDCPFYLYEPGIWGKGDFCTAKDDKVSSYTRRYYCCDSYRDCFDYRHCNTYVYTFNLERSTYMNCPFYLYEPGIWGKGDFCTAKDDKVDSGTRRCYCCNHYKDCPMYKHHTK